MTDENQQTLSGAGVDEQDTLDLDTLESHLWEAADILRGSIDAADYKNYIFGLLFLKRINDRFDEETEEIAEEYDLDEETVRDERDLHEEFWVPDRARWDHITSQTDNIGEALDKALIAVEDENDVIADRVLSTVDYNDKDRLSDATLDELVTHFSKHRYRNIDLEDPDIFGRAYEYLIRQFADDAGKKGGEFYTPREVVQLLVECVDPEPGNRVYDPCCGSGGMLIYSAEHIRDEGGDMDDVSEQEDPPLDKEFLSGEKLLYNGRRHRLRVTESEYPGPEMQFDGSQFILSVPEDRDVSTRRKRQAVVDWYYRTAEHELPNRAVDYIAKLGLRDVDIDVRELPSRWGEYRYGGIVLNWRLILAPRKIQDYVVAHELAHSKHGDHSDSFWNTVGTLVPDYRERREWLRVHGSTLSV